MALAFDIARCHGSGDMVLFRTICVDCRRREPGSDAWQAVIVPAAFSNAPFSPECPNKIERGN